MTSPGTVRPPGAAAPETSEHLRFAPDILSRLGEELVPNPEQGILELVRNAYDADAKTCAVELRDRGPRGADLVVTDTGAGMTRDAIVNGWLVLGRSRKRTRGGRRTPGGRLTVGDKGLGRLAALRMGHEAELATRPKAEPGVEYVLAIRWAAFDRAAVVEDVPLVVTRRSSVRPPGTTITVRRLRVPIGRPELERLARDLILLADPFGGSQAFRPVLIAPEFADLERRVALAYFGAAAFHLAVHLDGAGQASAELRDGKGRVLVRGGHAALWRAPTGPAGREADGAGLPSDVPAGPARARTARTAPDGPGRTSPPYRAPAAAFELWEFPLDKRRFTADEFSLEDVRAWLGQFGGIHLYHRGLRVSPYGDPGNDWLDINLARARSPEHRPSTNNALGRVVVPDPDEQLRPKTDRTGFLETDAFREVRHFAQDALAWMQRERVRLREARRGEARAKAPRAVDRAEASLDAALGRVPPEARTVVRRAVRRVARARDAEAAALRKEVQLYRTLSTVGTTVAVFAHQSAKPVSQIRKMIGVIGARGRAALDGQYDATLGRPVDIVERSTAALSAFTGLPLRLLERDKREEAAVDVHAALRAAAGWLEPFLANARIRLEFELADATPRVAGSVAALDAVITNLATNAINAFRAHGRAAVDRRVVVRTAVAGDTLTLTVLDNGPGIEGIPVRDVWLPGETRTGGTGLGLTIVRDVVADLGGTATARAHGGLDGGAAFIVTLPLVGAEAV